MAAMIAFPNFGKLLASGYQETVRPNIYRTNMEGGTAKQAQRYSITFIERHVAYRFTAREYANFKMWFYETVKHGARWFNWLDPVDNKTKEARMVEGKWQANPIDAAHRLWTVSFILETAQ